MERLNLPSNEYAYKNCVLMNIAEHIKNFDPKISYLAKIAKFYYKIEHNQTLLKNQIMIGVAQRREASIPDTNAVCVIVNDTTFETNRDKTIKKIIIDIAVYGDSKTIVNINKVII
jgi:hypothetical protein